PTSSKPAVLWSAIDAGLAPPMKGTGYKNGRWLDTMFMQRALGKGMSTDPDPSTYPGTLFNG
ncbi:hypothetical protein AB9F38_36450, partial [Rhizobium leguminosarum]